MSSPSPHGVIAMTPSTQPSVTLWLDTSNVQFQPTLDLGVAQTGFATFRATLYANDKWVDISNSLADDPAILRGGSEAGEFLARRQRDPERAKRLSKAREKLGQALVATYGEASGLAALRLSKGLSQTELAARMETQQPSIARWERAPQNMQFDTMEDMAHALGVELLAVIQAIKSQKSAHQKAQTHEAT